MLHTVRPVVTKRLKVTRCLNVPTASDAGFIGTLPPRLRPYASLMRLDRPIGTWLLYWPCAGAGAGGRRRSRDLFLGSRSAHRHAERGLRLQRSSTALDRSVERTAAAAGKQPGVAALRLAADRLAVPIGFVVLLQLNLVAAMVALCSIAPVAAVPIHEAHHLVAAGVAGLFSSWGALVDGRRSPNPRLAAPPPLAGASPGWSATSLLYAMLRTSEDDALVGVKSSARSGETPPSVSAMFYTASRWSVGCGNLVSPARMDRIGEVASGCDASRQSGVAGRSKDGKLRAATIPVEPHLRLARFPRMLVVGLSRARRAAMQYPDAARDRPIAGRARHAAGATSADALYVGIARRAVEVRLGELEEVSRSEGEEIGGNWSGAPPEWWPAPTAPS